MTPVNERFLLLLSAGFALSFAVAGVIIGLALNSSIILFDGLYSFISLGLTILSLVALRISRKANDERFPFGLSMVQPIALFFKYATISTLCILSINEGVVILIDGGRQVPYALALVYSLAAAFICYVIYLFFARSGSSLNSDLVNSEKNEWLMDTGLSGVLAIGFLIALILDSYHPGIASRVESLMLIGAATYFLKIPATGVLRAIKEIIGYKFSGRIEKDIRAYLDQILDKYEFETYFLRLQKVGSTMYIEIDFVVPKSMELSLEQQDSIRGSIYSMIQQYPFQWWYTLSFTHDLKWAR